MQLKCTFWCETNVCLKIYVWKHIIFGIIECISCSFFVSTNNHFIFSLCIFLISLRHSGRYFFSVPIRKGWGLKRGVCLQSHSRSRGSLLLGFWPWKVFEVFWIFTYQVVLTHSSVSSELQSHSTAGNLPTSLSGVKKPQEKLYFCRMVISLMGAQQSLLQDLRWSRNLCQRAESLIQLKTST